MSLGGWVKLSELVSSLGLRNLKTDGSERRAFVKLKFKIMLVLITFGLAIAGIGVLLTLKYIIEEETIPAVLMTIFVITYVIVLSRASVEYKEYKEMKSIKTEQKC